MRRVAGIAPHESAEREKRPTEKAIPALWAGNREGVSDLERDTYQRGTDAARVIQVIETKAVRGSGEKNQPFRTVIEYWSFDGKKLGEIDPLISAAE